VIGIGGDGPFAGRNGHDIREWFQIRRVISEFKPDVVHFHVPILLMAVYVKIFFRGKLVCSWHLPTDAESQRMGEKVFLKLVGLNCYFLPVSNVTWKGLRHWLPHVQGEVFFNPVRIGSLEVWKFGSLPSNPPNFQTSNNRYGRAECAGEGLTGVSRRTRLDGHGRRVGGTRRFYAVVAKS